MGLLFPSSNRTESMGRRIMNSKMIGQLLLVSSFFVLSSPTPKLLLVETEGDEGDIHGNKINHSGKKEQDFSLISDFLEDPDLVRSLIPKDTDEFFDIAEEIVPGMKALQAPVEETWSLLQPVLLELPDVKGDANVDRNKKGGSRRRRNLRREVCQMGEVSRF